MILTLIAKVTFSFSIYKKVWEISGLRLFRSGEGATFNLDSSLKNLHQISNIFYRWNLKIATPKKSFHVKWTYSQFSAWNNDFEWEMFFSFADKMKMKPQADLCRALVDSLLSTLPRDLKIKILFVYSWINGKLLSKISCFRISFRDKFGTSCIKIFFYCK